MYETSQPDVNPVLLQAVKSYDFFLTYCTFSFGPEFSAMARNSFCLGFFIDEFAILTCMDFVIVIKERCYSSQSGQ